MGLGVEHFHIFFYVTEFTIVTFHKPIVGNSCNHKNFPTPIEGWEVSLMFYDYKIIYPAGRDAENSA